MSKKLLIQEEHLWRSILAKQKEGVIEVNTLVGKIDVLCLDAIYEVKHARKWKHALGQVLAYGFLYPLHSKHIYLFGKPTVKKETIIDICRKYDVLVYFSPISMIEHSQELAVDMAIMKEKRENNE